MKVEEGVCLDLEAIRKAEEEEQHPRLKADKDTRLVEQSGLKADEEEEEQYSRIEAEEG